MRYLCPTTYGRNTLADAVRAKHNKMSGFLANHPEHDAVAHILAGALDEAEEFGYTIKILRPQNHKEGGLPRPIFLDLMPVDF